MAYSVRSGSQWIIEVEDCELTRELRQYGSNMVANRETRLAAAAELQLTTGRPYYTTPIRQMNIPGAAYLQRTSATSPIASRCKVFRELTDEDLRDGLRAAGRPAGPITHTTRELYIKHFRKRYPQKNVVRSSCCTQSVTLNADPMLPPIGNSIPAHQGLVPIPDLLADLNAATRPTPSPPPLFHSPPLDQEERQRRPMQLNGHVSPDHLLPRNLSQPVAREGSSDSTPSGPHPHTPPPVGRVSMIPAPSARTSPQRMPRCTRVQPPVPPAVNNSPKVSVESSPAAVHGSEGGAWRGGEPTSAQTHEPLRAIASNGTMKMRSTAECGSIGTSAGEDSKRKKGKERQSAIGLPTRSTQSSPWQQMFSQFHRLSTSGTHTASDVCFVLQNGDTLFASRGFLAVACPEMLPFLYNSEAPFQVTVNAFNGPSYMVWTRSNETIADIKLKLAMQVGVPVEQQRLVFQGKALEEVQTVAVSGVVQHSTLHLVLRHAPPGGVGAVRLVGVAAAHSTLSVQRLSLCAAGGHEGLFSSLQSTGRRSQAPPTAQQAPPTSHQSMSPQSSILAPVEVVLPLHISHVVLCEGFGAQALELVLSFLYTGSVDISEDVAIQLCILAEKFHIFELTDLALPIVRRTLHQGSLLFPLLVSFSEHLLRLQSVCLEFLLLPGNDSVLQHVCTVLSGDPEMLQQVQCAVELARGDC